MASTKQRIFLYVAAGCFALLATLAIALPWIYARAVPYLLAKQGVSVGSVSHRVFSTLVLRDVRYNAPEYGITLDAAELSLPAFYPLLRGAFSGGDHRGEVILQNWQLVLRLPESTPSKASDTLPQGTQADTAAAAAVVNALTAAGTATADATAAAPEAAGSATGAASPATGETTASPVATLTPTDQADTNLAAPTAATGTAAENPATASDSAQAQAQAQATATDQTQTTTTTQATSAVQTALAAQTSATEQTATAEAQAEAATAPLASTSATVATEHPAEASAAATAAPQAPQPPKTSAAEQVLAIRKLLMVADPWLGQVQLQGGRVIAGEHTLELPLVSWQGGTVNVEGKLPVKASTAVTTATVSTTPADTSTTPAADTAADSSANTSADASATAEPVPASGSVAASATAATTAAASAFLTNATAAVEGSPFTLELRRLPLPSAGLALDITLPAHDLTAQLRAEVPFSTQDTLNGTLAVQWKESRAEATAFWDTNGWVPQTASLQTLDFPIPAELIQLPGYSQPQFTLEARWEDKAGTIRLTGMAEGLEEEAPPFLWNLGAVVSPAGISIEALDLSGPWVKGELSQPLQLQWQQFLMQDNSVRAALLGQTPPPQDAPTLQLAIDMDLADFPFIPLEGQAQGTLLLRADPAGSVQGQIELSSQTISWKTIRLSTLKLQAQLLGGQIELNELDIRAEDGSYLTATGKTSLAERTIEAAEIKGNITDLFVRALGSALPKGENAEFVVQLFGPWADVSHAGQVRLNHIALESADEHFDAILQWEGRMLDIPTLSLSTVGDSLQADIRAAFNREAATGTDVLVLKEAVLRAGRYPPVRLSEPSTLTYVESAGTLSLTPLLLSSEGEGYLSAQIRLPQQGQKGQLSIQAEHVSGRWLEIYRNTRLPCPIGIDLVKIDFHWDGDQYLEGEVQLRAHAEPQYLPPVLLSLRATLDEKGLHLAELAAREGNLTLLEASADLPLSFYMDKEKGLERRLDMDAPLRTSIQADLSDPTFSKWLADSFRLHLDGVRSDIRLDGTLAKLNGRMDLSVDALSWERPPPGIPPLPRIESLQLKADFTPEQIRLTSLNAMLGNAPLIASATLPLSAQQRRDLITEGTVPPLDQATASFTTGDIPLQAFGPQLPPMLRTSGHIRLEAELQPGFALSGSIAIANAGTRPLPPLGSIEGIHAQISFRDHLLTIDHLQAQIGAQPVEISGQVDIANPETPRYDVKLTGGELPLVRSPGLILRARPDIALQTDEQGITSLNGSLELSRSFYTIDFAAIAGAGGNGGGGSSGAASRPPYFAIDEQPMASWRLNLRLYGDQFLRVRTPVFEGIVSANFNLRGPLMAPYAFGNARLDNGVVLFPFATLRVNSGTLTMQQDDPYTPRLDMNAQGRAYGYDLRMALTGTATDPNIQFDSTPSLEQSEILMLLSTGQIPNAPERSTMSRLSGLGMFLGNNVLINLGLSDPLDERFELLIGEDITEKDKDTITVRYRLTDDWSVIGSYDRFDAYNIDLQWTIYRD